MSYYAPTPTQRLDTMKNAWDIWLNHDISKNTEAPLFLEQLELRSSKYQYETRGTISDYAGMFYRLIMFFAQSKFILNKATEDPAALLVIIKTCPLNNLFQYDPDAFDEDIMRIELRKEDLVPLQPSKMFTCRHCKSDSSYYRKLQLHAGDEGQTAIGYCADCLRPFFTRL